ncbi:MAG: hypothetical protein JSV68_18700, partial [Anaerolineaceae bacterium]
NFDWPNRSFFAPDGTPMAVNTAFIGLAFLDCADHRITRRIVPSWLSTARSACDFILNDLSQHHPKKDEICFSYTPFGKRYVHNANTLAAQLLASVYAITKEQDLADAARMAVRYTVSHQKNDGSWYYGESGMDRWIDNFHTGFVLVSLKQIARNLETNELNDSLERGYQYWKSNMFLSNGTPKYYPNKAYPIDIHSVAQAILTFLSFVNDESEALEWAQRIAAWGINNMQDREGYFHYQIRRFYRNKIPYMRWSQAWMQRALTEYSWVTRNK